MVRLGIICVQIVDRRDGKTLPGPLMELLAPFVRANYEYPGLVHDGGKLQSSELLLHDSIQCSLIGCVVERSPLWCVVEVAAGPDAILYCL